MLPTNYLIRGIMLLLVGVSGNFTASTLGCSTQRFLRDNMYAKHVVAFLILYFAIDFSHSEAQDPALLFKTAAMIYGLFLLFTKMHITITIAVFAVLAAVYILTTFIEYYKHDAVNNKQLIDTLTEVQQNSFLALGSAILAGSAMYGVKQYNDHKGEWSTISFILGKVKCASNGA